MVFVRGGQTAQDNKSFFKVTPLIWAIEDQNNESYRGGLDLQKKKKNSHFLKNSQPRGGEGGSGEVGMVSKLLPVWSYDGFPKTNKLNKQTILVLIMLFV